MSDSSPWSLSLGRWRRVQVRVHALFILAAIFAWYLATGPAGAAYAAMVVGVLLASVLAHELGHLVAARRVGGGAESIVLGPLGGLGPLEIPREPHAELITILAGPLVNLAILLATLPALLLVGASVPALLDPLAPVDLLKGPWWMAALRLTFWFNWVLLVANLLPAFPLDGARMVRTILWPALDYRGATMVAVRTSKLTALGLCVWAWLVRDAQSAAGLPSWLLLVMLAIFLYFSGSHEAAKTEEADWQEDLLSYDFSQGYTSLERTSEPRQRPAGMLHRWLKNRRELRRRRQETIERDEERQVDAILSRLHSTGMDGLTGAERALLHRVSARYRDRQRG